MHVAFNNVDYAILAARLSAHQAGFYWRAFNLGVVYQDKLSGVMLKVAFPVYSRTSSIEELRRLHSRATRVLATVIFPLQALLIVLAPLLIPFAFGPAWEEAVVPAQILGVAGMAAAILTGYPQVMLAVGQPKALLRFNLAMLAGFATVVALASGQGLAVIAVAVVVAYAAILLGAYRFLLQRHAGIPMWSLLRELAPAVVGCFALAAVAVPLRFALETAGAPRRRDADGGRIGGAARLRSAAEDRLRGRLARRDRADREGRPAAGPHRAPGDAPRPPAGASGLERVDAHGTCLAGRDALERRKAARSPRGWAAGAANVNGGG